MAWTDIFSSSNFWTAVSGFGGTALGGYITWRTQRNSHDEKQRLENIAIFRYHITKFEKIYSTTKLLWTSLSEKKNLVDRHIHLRRIVTALPDHPNRDITLDLYFLASRENMELIGKMEDYARQSKIFSEAFKERNLLMDAVIQSTQGHQSNEILIEEIKRLAGIKLNSDLKTVTDLVYQSAEFLTNEYPQLRLLMGREFKRKFPEEHLLVFDLDPNKYADNKKADIE